eukprot:5579674-Pyramimonas_sp.AAC.1
MALAAAPRTSVLTVCSSFTDGGRVVFGHVAPALAPRTFVFKVRTGFTGEGRFLLQNGSLARSRQARRESV